MRQVITPLGWALAAFMAAVLSFVSLYQRQSLNAREDALAAALSNGLFQLAQKLDASNSRWQSLLDSHRQEFQVRKEPPAALPAADANPGKSELAVGLSDADKDIAGAEDPPERPPIPKGMRPRDIVTMDLSQILADPVLNPKGKRLTAVETARARAELVRAQSEMNVLDSEIRIDYNLAVEEMRPRGEFTEYQPGQKYQTFKGVRTFGEIMPGGGVRMFYLYPESHPDLYAKIKRKYEVAGTAARQVLAMLQE